MIIAKFDSFVRSLDNIFPQPSCLNNNPSFLFQQPTSPSIDLVDARKRLCSLLPIHLHILADSSKLTELVHLSTKLQKHTSLNSDQLSMLKMVIEEVPHLSEQSLKVKELADQVETFVASLQSNLTKATLMLKQYNDTKKAVSNLQGEMYANAYAMRETDDQIRRLRIRRSELVRIGEMKKNAMEELDSYLKKKKQDLRNIAEEIKVSNATKRELEINLGFTIPPTPPTKTTAQVEVDEVEDQNQVSIALKRRKTLTPVDFIKQIDENSPAAQKKPNYLSVTDPNTTLTLYTNTNPRLEIIAKFNSFLRSLDNIFPQPACIDLVDSPKSLASLLPMDLDILDDHSAKLTELVHLSTKLQKETGLNSDQLSMLKMIIEEVPHLNEQTLKLKELREQVEKCAASLDSNLTKATLMLEQYSDSKKEVSNLQVQMDANTNDIKETDDQIMKLQNRRFELAEIGEMKKNAMVELDSSLKNMKQNLLNIVEENNFSNGSKELEAKKKSLSNHCNEIIARFAPLKSFRIE
ncbi:hypothetical protein ACOSQ2_024039 [Xanthoceras sorbifolium]